MQVFLQVSSLIGAFLILAAFVALQRRRWTSEQPIYLWCNLVGALLLGIVAVADRRIGFILIEIVWVAVSVQTLVRVARGDVHA